MAMKMPCEDQLEVQEHRINNLKRGLQAAINYLNYGDHIDVLQLIKDETGREYNDFQDYLWWVMTHEDSTPDSVVKMSEDN